MKSHCIPYIERVGKIYGNITIISVKSHIEYKDTKYNCLCICGKNFVASSKVLFRTKRPKLSCGCIIYERKKYTRMDPWKRQFNVWLHSNTGQNKNSSKKRSLLECTLNFEDWKNLSMKNCNYCGVEPYKPLKMAINIFINGIDRIDSNIGYVKENCVACCKTCNFAKRDLSLNDFKIWIKNIYNFQNKKNYGKN